MRQEILDLISRDETLYMAWRETGKVNIQAEENLEVDRKAVVAKIEKILGVSVDELLQIL